MYVCLVCHTEPDVWNGGYASIDRVLPRFVTLVEGIHDQSGGTPRIAWCLTGQVARNRPKPFKELVALGHEIGVHSHFISDSGNLEHSQDLNTARLSTFDRWFPELCQQIVDAGFPQPRTHASWMFAYPEHMTGVLARSGIRVDCSVCYGGAHYLAGGALLADSTGRIDGKPYQPSDTDHCIEGSSGLVELPVSGGFGSYWEPDGRGRFEYFSPVASDHEMERQLGLFERRLRGLREGAVDIFQLHFHLYEFLEPAGISEERMRRAAGMLRSMASDSQVRFSTPSNAAADWLRAFHIPRLEVGNAFDHR